MRAICRGIFTRQKLTELLGRGDTQGVVAVVAGFADTCDAGVGLDDNVQPVSAVIDVDNERGDRLDFHGTDSFAEKLNGKVKL